MATPRYPSLYQINTRVWLTELSHTLGRRAVLDGIPDADLDHLTERGCGWRLSDRMDDAVYDRDGAELAARVPYLDMPAWGYHAFAVQPAGGPGGGRN